MLSRESDKKSERELRKKHQNGNYEAKHKKLVRFLGEEEKPG